MPPRLARLLAAVVAIALVAGAFVVRGVLSDDDDEDVATGPGPQAREEAVFQLVCDEDVGKDVCDAVAAAADPALAIDVEVVRAGDVIDRVISGEALPDWDVWLTLDGIPGVLDVARVEADLAPLTSTAPVDVASSPLVLLALPEPPGGCDDVPAVAWTCLVETGARPAVAVPASDTALGILAIAAGATALHGDVDFGIGAFRGTPASDLLDAFLESSPRAAGSTTADQAGAMVLSPGAASGAITLGAIADRQANTERGQGRGLRSVALDPEVVVGLTLVGLSIQGQDAVDALVDGLTGQTVEGALDDAGWTGAPGPTTGLPTDADLIYALREELG